jgi:chromosome segregation ATPase
MNLFKTSSLMLALSLLAMVSVSADMDNMDVKSAEQEVDAIKNDMESAEEKVDQAKETAEQEVDAIKNGMESAEEKIDQAGEKAEALEEKLEDAETDDEDASMDPKDHTGAVTSAGEDMDSAGIDAPHKSMNDDAASKKLDEEISNLLKQIAESQEKEKFDRDSTDVE